MGEGLPQGHSSGECDPVSAGRETVLLWGSHQDLKRGRTRWNRARFGLGKPHALDALAIGDLTGVKLGKLTTLQIRATGRGQHCRTLWNRYGFPRTYLPRHKMVAGLLTGDRVKAVVPAPLKTARVHVGRVVVRTTGFCAIRTSTGTVDGINVSYLRLVQRGDGYEYL